MPNNNTNLPKIDYDKSFSEQINDAFKPIPLSEKFINQSQEQEKEIDGLKDQLNAAKNLLLEYEQWEAELLITEEIMALSKPTLEKMVVLQRKRNEILHPEWLNELIKK